MKKPWEIIRETLLENVYTEGKGWNGVHALTVIKGDVTAGLLASRIERALTKEGYLIASQDVLDRWGGSDHE